MATHGTIGEFDSDRETWKSYTERLVQYFAANDVDSAEKKRAILLSVCGPATYQLIRNILAPVKPTERSFTDLVDLVEQHKNPKPSVIVQRYNFNTRRQQPGESIAAYTAELRKIAEHCSFGDTLEVMLRDRIVCGINDTGRQRRLLAEPDLTFQSAFKMVQAWETAESNAKDLQKPQQGASVTVNRVVRTVQPTSTKPNQGANSSSANSTSCKRCGGQHPSSECKHKQTKCHLCQKKGHLARVCQSKQQTNSAPTGKKFQAPQHGRTHLVDCAKQPSDEPDTYSLFTLTGQSSKPFLVTVNIHSTTLVMEVDTGASCSLISETTYKMLQTQTDLPPLQSTTAQLCTYTGEQLPILGILNIPVSYHTQTVTVELVVVKGDGPSLMGRDLLQQIRLDWHSLHQIQSNLNSSLEALLTKHQAVFAEGLGKVKGFTAKLHVSPDAQPCFYKPRPVPHSLRTKLEKELKHLESLGIIEPVQFSDWAVPIVPVLKTNGELRVCGDYKLSVNRVAKLETYPLPRIEDLFTSLAGGKTFSKLDLAHAYLQVELDQSVRKYVTINTHKGLYTYNRLPFGVASAPAIFQRMMESILQGLMYVCVYIDDILVTGTSEEEHLKNLSEVLSRLENAGLHLKKDKCSFMLPEVQYLGHKISARGLEPSDEKIKAIKEAPTPENVTQLKSFLGAVNYYCKFLPNLANNLCPLYKLLQHRSKWTWGPEQIKAFETAKQQLASPPLLVHYDPEKPLVLSCDASPYGLGAVLSHSVDRVEQPIAFASRTLAPPERNYSQLDKEALAIIFGVKHFHDYVVGRKFTIISDHKPLQYLFNEKKAIPQMTSARVQRWALTLSSYDYNISYKSGKQHCNADMLSRLPIAAAPTEVPVLGDTILLLETLQSSPVTAKLIKTWTNRDPLLSRVRDKVKRGWIHTNDPKFRPYQRRYMELSVQSDCVLWGNRIIVPPAGQSRVLDVLHDGHPGICRMKELARSFVWWPGLKDDIQNKVQSCTQCQINQRSPAPQPLHPWEWPEHPWSRLHIDYAGPIRNRYLLVVIDSFSKWLDVAVVPLANSTNTIQSLRNIFSTHGLPQVIVSDNGAPFVSTEFKEFLFKNGIRHTTTPPYHPKSNGQVERAVQTVKRALKKSSSDNLETQLCRFLFKYRITPHATTGVPPSQLLMNRHLRSHLDLLRPDLSAQVKQKRELQKDHHDQHSYLHDIKEGEKVYVKDLPEGKTWLPGTISKKDGKVTYHILLDDGRIVRRHIDHVRKQICEPTTETDSHMDSDNDVFFDMPSPADECNERVADQNDSTSVDSASESSTTEVRRSNRIRRPPMRYQDDSWTT